MDSFVHQQEEAATLEKFLRALEAMADELAARKPEDLTFKVSVRDDVPLVGILGNLINSIGVDWESHMRRENERTVAHNRELSRAYEALQAKNEEIQRDLDAARRVQLQLLPQIEDAARCPEVEFAGHFQSKDKVGGDIYDFFRAGVNTWAFLIADVAGHGISSALIGMFLKAAFRTRARAGIGADAICREVNTDICAVVSDLGIYATAFFGLLDLETGGFRYANCGHTPVHLHRADGRGTIRLEEKGMLLGALEQIEVEESTIGLEPGDILLATTDGIAECRNYHDEMYGWDRLVASFTDACAGLGARATAQDIIHLVIAGFSLFSLDATPDDDITATALRFKARAVGRGRT